MGFYLNPKLMDFYIVIVVILMAVAIVDLIVGVSNDAVNFLNSAIGSKVAPFSVILMVASLGIVLGSLFSSGMMEIARNGIFNPGFFTFDKIIIVFLAVMLTDILLLDFFNSLGLPTSTTVSLVFELLGAALVTGLMISFDRGQVLETWKDIINYSSAITIISILRPTQMAPPTNERETTFGLNRSSPSSCLPNETSVSVTFLLLALNHNVNTITSPPKSNSQ